MFHERFWRSLTETQSRPLNLFSSIFHNQIMNSRITTLAQYVSGIFLVCTSVTAGGDILISDSGQARVTILVAGEAGPPVRHAASELTRYLSQVTGAKFTTRSTIDQHSSVIAVGPRAAAMVWPQFTTTGLQSDGIVIRTVGNRLILAGGKPRGTLYAVYTFLEDVAGCHWWSPAAETVPRRPALSVGKLNIRYVPQFEYRDISYHQAADADFSVRNRLNGHHHRLFIDNGYRNVRSDVARGGRRWNWLRSDKWACHALYTLIPPEIYLASHPEWFAELRDDQPYGTGYIGYPNASGEARRPRSVKECKEQLRSLCLSNRDMRREVIRNVRWAMTWGVSASLWDLSQIDGMNPCRCTKCMDIVNQEGAYSGLTLQFTNEIAKEFVKTSGSHFTTLAYHYSRRPPRHTKPGENVIVRLVTAYDELTPGKQTNISFSVPLDHERNRSFAADLSGWCDTGGRIYIYDYAACFSHPLMPYPNLHVLGPNMRLFRDRGIRGYASEAHNRTPGTELAELRTWLTAKLAWNPDLDDRELIRTFCNGYYGAAGPHVVQYINGLHTAVAETEEWLHIGWGYDAGYLDWKYVHAAWKTLSRARAAVADNEELLFRVEVVQLSLLYVFLMRWDEFRASSRKAGDAWPLNEDPGVVLNEFIRIAVRKKITLLERTLEQSPIQKILRKAGQ